MNVVIARKCRVIDFQVFVLMDVTWGLLVTGVIKCVKLGYMDQAVKTTVGTVIETRDAITRMAHVLMVVYQDGIRHYVSRVYEDIMDPNVNTNVAIAWDKNHAIREPENVKTDVKKIGMAQNVNLK